MRSVASTSTAAATWRCSRPGSSGSTCVARQLDLLWTYLESDEPMVDEPSLGSDEAAVDMNMRIVQAQEAERQRMAGDIHDGPAQVLTNAIFQVEYLDRMLGDGDRAAQSEVAFLRDMLRNGLDEVRTFITDLRPPVMDGGLGDRDRRTRAAAPGAPRDRRRGGGRGASTSG